MQSLNKICSIAVEIALLLLFILCICAPLHAGTTRHFDVETIDSSHVNGITVGSRIPLYRFNYNWQVPLGDGVVDSLEKDSAIISFNAESMNWPIGRSAKIMRTADTYYIPLGSDVGLSYGDQLNIFKDRNIVGQATISNIAAQQSQIQLPAALKYTDGLFLADYTFVTQATYFSSPLLSGLEMTLIILSLGAYIVFYGIQRRSPFIAAGTRLQNIQWPKRIIFWTVHILAWIPFTWFMATMPLYLISYLVSNIHQYLFEQSLYVRPIADTVLPYAYTIVGLTYIVYLFWYRHSPILAVWKFISYKKKSTVKGVNFSRGFLLWALHLIIVYVFARTLLSFLIGDLSAGLTLLRHLTSPAAVFEMLKNFIWALTVVGCLLGYGYSILSILWGHYIRNLDFTVVGWLTNGFAYPLFGAVIWQMTPSFTGIDPIITAGPLYTLMLILGLVFNLLYMFSIWNLGTKFDLMTDKGVRTSLFYSVIRHPNYLLEAAMFLVLEMVGFSGIVQATAFLATIFIYWIRSEREDNFMQHSNPDYEAYQKATPYKFIPGIY
jgi:protein-S-isoprenylcysteine O-methyltransferase Ste14